MHSTLSSPVFALRFMQRCSPANVALLKGFGDSPYLQSCLRTAFPNLALVIPADEG